MSAALEFTAPPRGLQETAFDLNEIEKTDGRLFTLRNEETGIRLFIVAGDVMPTYRPELSDDQAEELGLESPEDAALFAIVNPSNGRPTVNLLAPIVVNKRTNTAAQVILDGDWPVSQPLDEMV